MAALAPTLNFDQPPQTAEAPGKPTADDESQWQLRLVIAVPVLLILVILVYGLVSYLAFSTRWDALSRAGAGELAGELLRIHMIAMIALAIVAAFMGLGLSYTILRPIRALALATQQVACGQLNRRAPQLPATRELNDLSRSFNTMIDNLNHSIAERNRCLMEGIPIGVMTTDMEGRISAASPLAAEVLGVTSDALIGRSLGQLRETLPGDLSRKLMGELSGMVSTNWPSTSRESILIGPREGQELTVTATLLRDAQGEAFGVMFSFRESARMRDLSDHLSHTDQLAALGTFTLGLAHELRNPLAAVKGLSQLLQLEPGLPERAAEFLGRMNHEVDRVDAFVHQLLDMTEQPVACLSPTRLADVMRRAEELARAAVPAAHAAAVQLHCELEPIAPLMLEADRLTQAFAKIIQNAYEATPVGGAITLRTRLGGRQGHPVSIVEVQNTGSTIAPEQRKKIFEPFFSTHDRATGLGLTIANQIVVQNGGALDVVSGPEVVTFVATFEAARAAEPAATGTRGGCA